MKKSIFTSLIFLSFFTLITVQSYAESAEDVLQKLIKAFGGKAAMEKVADTKLTGTFELQTMNMQGTYQQFQKMPDKLRIDIKMMGNTMTQSFDGKTAWIENPQSEGPQEMPAQRAKEFSAQSLGYLAFLNPEKYNVSYSFKGKENGSLLLEQTAANGFKKTLFIDPDTFLIQKIKSVIVNERGTEADSESIFLDYKKVNGLMISHKIKIIQNGKPFLVLMISTVEHNVGLKNSFFERPR